MTSSDYRGPTAKPPRAAKATNPGVGAVAETEAAPAPAPLRRTGYALTDLGRKRAMNEDAFFIDDQLGLYVVADGMGGHAAGEVASREAVDTLYGMVKRGIGELRELVDPVSEADARAACRLMESAVQAATYFVFSIAEIDRDKSGMGTTISALLDPGRLRDHRAGGRQPHLPRRARPGVEQLTEDHTLIAWQLKQGLITPQEAARSPHRNVITRAVGNREYVQVDTRCVPPRAGRALPALQRRPPRLPARRGHPGDRRAWAATSRCSRFIDLANERGGKDNITAVLVEID